MKTNITFVSASAGSGKTYRITEIIEEKLTRGACRAGGLIATTFTVKAAQELRERVRRRLYDAGQATLAERMDEGLIGTVDSVCGRLLGRFAFEAGISPQLEVLDEKEAAVLLSKAVEAVIDFDTLTRIQKMADRLGQKSSQTEGIFLEKAGARNPERRTGQRLQPQIARRNGESEHSRIVGILASCDGR